MAGVRRELIQVGVGVAAGTAVMLIVMAFFGKADWQTALGAAVGAALAFGNFFFTARAVLRALDRESQAVSIIRRSYVRRMAVMAAVLALGFYTKLLWWPAAVIPLIFPKLSIYLFTFFAKKEDEL